MEIMINRKMKSLDVNMSGNFKLRVDRLAGKLRKIGQKLPIMLPKTFYDLRSSIIHGGKEPTIDELDLMLKFMHKFAEMI